MKAREKIICTVLMAFLIQLMLTACSVETPEMKKTPETTIADGLCKINVEGTTDLPGNFFLSFVFSRNLIMLDGKGNIVWSKHEDQETDGTLSSLTGWWDFKKHEVDGKTFYSYHDQTGAYDNYGMLGYAPGERVILDADFNEVKRITFETSDVTEKGDPLDGHDFLMIGPDHYILSGYLKDTVYNVPGFPDGSSVLYSYLQEVKDGEVVWDWKSIDYPELYELTILDGSETASDYANVETDVPDYVHFNSMRIDKDGNLICSFRHLSSVLCLDRSQRENQTLWILSGKGDMFGLNEAEKSSCQHYATLDGNYLTLFDNGNSQQETRVISYLLNKDNTTSKAVRIYSFPGKYSQACGSVQHLQDNLYVIGWGWATKDAKCMSVYDFSAGKELLSITLDNPQNITYRCVYYD